MIEASLPQRRIQKVAKILLLCSGAKSRVTLVKHKTGGSSMGGDESGGGITSTVIYPTNLMQSSRSKNRDQELIAFLVDC